MQDVLSAAETPREESKQTTERTNRIIHREHRTAGEDETTQQR